MDTLETVNNWGIMESRKASWQRMLLGFFT